jgi:glycosyltransferase involved in cell wall biosynthesis
VHLQGPIGRFDFLYFPWLRARGARVVYTAHNPRPRTGAVGLLDRARYRQVDALITLSRTGVRDLIDDGVAAEKIAYIPHGTYLQLCTRTFAPQEARRMLGIPPDARVVLFFGGMSPYKGLDVLIDAMAVLRVRQPDAFLLAAGPSKRGIDSYRARIDAHGLTRIVALRPGYVPLEQVPLYFSSADVVVLPYRGSYQSGVVHLAYAFARPVVVSNIRDLREQVLEDGTGLVAGLDPTEFGGALAELLNDPGRSSAMGRRGRDLAETKYSWETIARQTLEVYARVGVDMSLAQSRAH